MEPEHEGSAIKGLIVGVVITFTIAYLIYKIIQWWISTQPPIRFH